MKNRIRQLALDPNNDDNSRYKLNLCHTYGYKCDQVHYCFGHPPDRRIQCDYPRSWEPHRCPSHWECRRNYVVRQLQRYQEAILQSLDLKVRPGIALIFEKYHPLSDSEPGIDNNSTIDNDSQ